MKKVTLKAKPGQKKITFNKGGLHQSLGVAQGVRIPPAMIDAAMGGHYGAKAKRQAMFMHNVLTGKSRSIK